MERPVFKVIGTAVEDLDTPTLVVNRDVLQQNINTLHSFFRQRETKVRPHVASHLCPAIARMQLAAGGTVSGICATTVGQAEVFAEHGFFDIFVANEVVWPQKIVRLCSLAHNARITVAADNSKNVQDLSEAAITSGVTLDVVVDINTRLNRCGVEPGRSAVELALAISKARGLNFVGLMSYEGTILEEDRDRLAAESRKSIQKVLDTREMVERAKMEVKVVSVGGTYNYQIAGTMAGVTEVPAGSYALMDYRYCRYLSQFRPAARVMATVTSHPEPGTVTTDCGQKAISSDYGMPSVEDVPGVTVVSLSAEHGRLRLEGDADEKVDLGDKIWMTPWEIGTCVNLYDYIHVVRDGKLEAVWSVAARGRYR